MRMSKRDWEMKSVQTTNGAAHESFICTAKFEIGFHLFHREAISALATSPIMDPILLLLDLMWGSKAISAVSIGLACVDPTF
jgi:hypothetical protein